MAGGVITQALLIYTVAAVIQLSSGQSEIICPDLSAPANGMIFYDSGRTGSRSIETIATYSCNPGYYLTGGSPRTCLSDRTWSGSAPTCTAVSCGLPPSIPNGSPGIPTSKILGGKVTYTCDTGYKLSGLATVTCQADGTWSTLPTCQIPPVYLSLGSTNYIANNSEIKIESIRESDDQALICHIYFTPCCKASDTLSGVGIGEWKFPNGTNIQARTTIDYSVTDVFYRSRFSPIIRLHRRGNVFSPTGSYCCEILSYYPYSEAEEMTFCANIVVCLSLPPLTNGMISYNDSTLGLGTRAVHSCDAGYRLIGDITRICRSGGSWSGSAPYCPGTVSTFSCIEGHVLIGDSTQTCQSDGTWSSTAPYCADQAIVQLKFGPTDYCLHWDNEDWLLRQILPPTIKKAVLAEGNITIPLDHISEGIFSCFAHKNQTTYRTTITGTETATADKAVVYLQKWVESGAVTQMLWYLVFFDKNCPVHILSMSEKECL